MARDSTTPITFSYRPALTWVVISGTCTRTRSTLASVAPTVQRELAVTTEVTADPRTSYTVSVTAKQMADQRRAWTLLADGRLTGSETTVEADPYAGWRAALRIGAAVAAVAAPVLVPFSPALAVGALAVAGGGAAASALRETARFAPGPRTDVDADMVVPEEPPPTPDWAALGIAPEYADARPDAAATLAAWRTVIRDLTAAHLDASRRAVGDPVEGRRAQAMLTATLASVRAESAPAEAVYRTWVAGTTTRTVEDVVVRLPIDTLPSTIELTTWAATAGEHPDDAARDDDAPQEGTTAADDDARDDAEGWRTVADRHRLVVSVDPDPRIDVSAADPPTVGERLTNTLHYRPPRPVTVRVWTVGPTTPGTPVPLDLVRTFHVLATWPGNEQVLATPDSARGMAATFGEDGSLRTLSAELVDKRLQRARALAELPDAVKAGAETGQTLRDVFAPPTLQERAAEHEAAGKLGLLPTTPDPLAEERRRLEREELEARIRIAEQLGRSSSDVATVVHING